MTPESLVLAHSGHWALGLVYFAPVVIIVLALRWRERRFRDPD